MKRINKPMLCAALLMALFTAVGTLTAHAQTDNPLISTTGAATMERGSSQLSFATGWYHYDHSHSYGTLSPNELGINQLGLSLSGRYALTDRLEVSLGAEAIRSESHYSSALYDLDSTGVVVIPSLGLRYNLYQGKGWLPQVTFATRLSLFVPTRGNNVDFQSCLALQFRNRLGTRWLLDYSLGYTLGDRISNTAYRENPQFSIMARWLATERLMVGFGAENRGGRLELLWQPTPSLQLSLAGAVVPGYGKHEGELETDLHLGASWRL